MRTIGRIVASLERSVNSLEQVTNALRDITKISENHVPYGVMLRFGRAALTFGFKMSAEGKTLEETISAWSNSNNKVNTSSSLSNQ